MLFVMPQKGYTIRDPERRDIIPADKWRQVGDHRYWRRLARDRDVLLREAEILPAGKEMPAGDRADGRLYIREEDIEGYEEPAKAVAAPADAKPASAARE